MPPLFGRPTAADDRKADACRDWLRRRNPLAIASLVLGVFSFIEFGALLLFGIAGILLGVLALRQLHTSHPAASAPALGHRLAWTGIALSTASLVIAAVLYSFPRP